MLSASITWFLASTLCLQRGMFTESTPMRSLCRKSTWPSRVVSLATRRLCLFLACQKVAASRARSRDTQRGDHLDSIETPDTHWETFGQRDTVLRDGLRHEVVMHLCITQVGLSVLSASITWFLAFPSAHKAHAVLRYSWNLSQSRLGSLQVRALSSYWRSNVAPTLAVLSRSRM